MFKYRGNKEPPKSEAEPSVKKVDLPIAFSDAQLPKNLVSKASQGIVEECNVALSEDPAPDSNGKRTIRVNSADSLRKFVTGHPPNFSEPRPISSSPSENHQSDHQYPNLEERNWLPSWSVTSAKWFSSSSFSTSDIAKVGVSANSAHRNDPGAAETLSALQQTPLQLNQVVGSDAKKSTRDNSINSKEEPSSNSQSEEDLDTNSSRRASRNSRNSKTSWAFWQSDANANKRKNVPEEAELAVEGTDSETHPRHVMVQPPPKKALKTDTDKIGLSKDSAKPNLVLPSFEMLPWQSKAQYLRSLLTMGRSGQDSEKLVRVSTHPPQKVVVIGVHGYFPARVTRAILGEPKGTSIKFANEASAMLKQLYPSVTIEQIALEGEGKINHRISTLYSLLMNWKESLSSADLVVFAAHSQGAVVSIQILRKLLEDRLIRIPKHRVAILAMAGTFLGPMPGMDRGVLMKAISRIENDSLLELFELQNPLSDLGRDLTSSLELILKHGAKVILCGSADDQLVPLYSALCIHINHPNIFRTVYIDGEDVAPEVVAPLLELALKHRNLGNSDHNLITEMSGPLAGALTSKGHSKLYNCDDVYRLGINIALDTAPIIGIRSQVLGFRLPKSNPYLLPWAAHALISAADSREDDKKLLTQLLNEYKEWHPQSKPMKDLKFQLGALEPRAHSASQSKL